MFTGVGEATILNTWMAYVSYSKIEQTSISISTRKLEHNQHENVVIENPGTGARYFLYPAKCNRL